MRSRALLSIALTLGLAACSSQTASFRLGVPGMTNEMSVAKVKLRGGYLDTVLTSGGFTLRTFLPGTEKCTRIAEAGASLTWVNSGPLGGVERGGERCEAIGMGSLHEWRNRQPRGQSASIIPSGTAVYQTIYQDEEYVLLRGRFPQTGRIGFSGMGDNISVVANSAICQRPIEAGRSTIEFFPGGRNVLTLSSSGGRCQIEGLIRPLAPADVEP